MSATIDNGGFLIMAKKTHGMYNTRVYHIWEGIKQRTLNPNYPRFHDYGGRGIDLCDDWHDFDNFYNDMGEPLEHESIDRIDNNKGYYVWNCRWATIKEQNRNKRTPKTNKLGEGCKGVHLRSNGTYRVYISINCKQISLGTFKTLEEAKEARKQGELKYWN